VTPIDQLRAQARQARVPQEWARKGSRGGEDPQRKLRPITTTYESDLTTAIAIGKKQPRAALGKREIKLEFPGERISREETIRRRTTDLWHRRRRKALTSEGCSLLENTTSGLMIVVGVAAIGGLVY